MSQQTYEGWPNLATWTANTIITNDQTAYMTMKGIVPRLKGNKWLRAGALSAMWPRFCQMTRISDQVSEAFMDNEVSQDDVDWAAILEQWDIICQEEEQSLVGQKN